MDESLQARFAQTILPHLDAAYNLARWLTREDAAAEDVTHDAMLRALTFFASFRGGEGRPWLLAIVRNTYFDWRRKAHRTYAEEPFDEELPDHSGSHPMHEPRSGDPLLLLMKKSEGEAVTQALLRIEEAYREVLVLRELEELSYKEIATVVGAPMGTVMSRLARARKRLREELNRSVAAA